MHRRPSGEKWKFHRAMTRPFFTRDRISDFDIFDTHASKALTLAKERLEAGYPVDFQDLVGRFTLDSASVFLFDEDLESLSAGLAYPFNCSKENASNHQYREHPSNLFADAFLDAITKGTRRTFWGQEWPLAEFWSDVVKPGREVIDRFAEKVINGRLKKGGGAEFEERDTLLEHLLNKTTDTRMIKDELFSMLVAGRDTTSCTLSYAMYNMTQHPEVVARLREEVMEYVGPTKRPTYDDIKGMKYIRAFINEVLRLYPPVPLNWRQPQKSTVFKTKDGPRYYIPAKTTVRYSVWAMHRRKDLWGPDADKFDPDRFLDERLKEYLIPNPFIFVPFNAGPRICLGQQFAYNEVSFFLIRLLQQFSEFELAQDAQDPQFAPPASWAQCEGTKGTDKVMPGANLTLYIKGGLWVRMK
ncbi:cytochrome P450 [Coprinopsis cinerea AmutBmut pab1-1]|nr:cytochrome P450 [Coprinopsis cinerea AmutBmut pab1-1]